MLFDSTKLGYDHAFVNARTRFMCSRTDAHSEVRWLHLGWLWRSPSMDIPHCMRSVKRTGVERTFHCTTCT